MCTKSPGTSGKGKTKRKRFWKEKLGKGKLGGNDQVTVSRGLQGSLLRNSVVQVQVPCKRRITDQQTTADRLTD